MKSVKTKPNFATRVYIIIFPHFKLDLDCALYLTNFVSEDHPLFHLSMLCSVTFSTLHFYMHTVSHTKHFFSNCKVCIISES